ncbi:hypothetical protein RYX36_015282 [Vicia faba]
MNLHPAKWLAGGSNLGYFHDDTDYEIPLKPPYAISKLEKGCTPEAFTRVCRFIIFPPPLKFLFSAMTMILTRYSFPNLLANLLFIVFDFVRLMGFEFEIKKLNPNFSNHSLNATLVFDSRPYYLTSNNFIITFVEISVCIVDMFAILGVIEKNNIRHNALLVSSCLMDCIKSLLEKHEIIRGFYLGLVLTTGYECNDIIGRKFFVLAATHGSFIHACKLFEKFPYKKL